MDIFAWIFDTCGWIYLDGYLIHVGGFIRMDIYGHPRYQLALKNQISFHKHCVDVYFFLSFLSFDFCDVFSSALIIHGAEAELVKFPVCMHAHVCPQAERFKQPKPKTRLITQNIKHKYKI